MSNYYQYAIAASITAETSTLIAPVSVALTLHYADKRKRTLIVDARRREERRR